MFLALICTTEKAFILFHLPWMQGYAAWGIIQFFQDFHINVLKVFY